MPTREVRARRLGLPIDQLPDGRGKGPKAKGSNHYRWNKGKIINSDGYVKVRVGCNHPLADPNGYAYEHLLVWVAAGKPVPATGELLHHKDEDRQNNRIENLEIQKRGNHNRQHLMGRERDELGRFLPKRAAGRLLDGKEWNEFPGGEIKC